MENETASEDNGLDMGGRGGQLVPTVPRWTTCLNECVSLDVFKTACLIHRHFTKHTPASTIEAPRDPICQVLIHGKLAEMDAECGVAGMVPQPSNSTYIHQFHSIARAP